MLIRRCAWHRQFHGYALVHGIASWRGCSVAFSDGVCRGCAARVRAEWQLARSSALPAPSAPGLTPMGMRRLAVGVGFALLATTVLPTRLISDVMLGDPPEAVSTPAGIVQELTPDRPALPAVGATVAETKGAGKAAGPVRSRPGPVRRVSARPTAVRAAEGPPAAGAPAPSRRLDGVRAPASAIAQAPVTGPVPQVVVASVAAPRPTAARVAGVLDDDIARGVVRRASARLLLAPPEDRPRHAGTFLQTP